jgi:hypothetical protein
MCITVLLADDTAVMRRAIRTLLGREPGIELVGEAKDFAQTVSLTRKFRARGDGRSSERRVRGSVWKIGSTASPTPARIRFLSVEHCWPILAPSIFTELIG